MARTTAVFTLDSKGILEALRAAVKTRAGSLFLLFPAGPFPELTPADKLRALRYLGRIADVTVAKLGFGGDNAATKYLGLPLLRLPKLAAGYQFALSLPPSAQLAVFADTGESAAVQVAAARGGAEFLAEQPGLIRRVGVPFGNDQFRFRAVPGAGAVLVGGTLTLHAVIPSQAAATGVIGVDSGAFRGNKLRSLYAGENLSFVGANSFTDCPDLQEVLFPDGIELIGAGAFANCPQLSRVRLPGSIHTIEAGAFSGCSPELTVQVVQGSAAHLYAVQEGIRCELMPPGANVHASPGGQLLTEGATTFLTLPGGTAQVVSAAGGATNGHVTIPAQIAGFPVVGVGSEALAGNTSVQSVTLPSSVLWVAENAFTGAENLRNVNGLRGVPFRAAGAAPETVASSGGAAKVPPFDFDRVRITPRMLARILDVPVPDLVEQIADSPLAGVASILSMTRAGDAYFKRGTPPGPKTVEKILAKGARMFVATRVAVDATGRRHPTLLVEDPLQASVAVATWFRAQYPCKTIALTGSVGKTTTKEMLRRVAQTEFVTMYNRGNANVHTRVLRNIQGLTFQTQVYVQETGASFPGHVDSMGQMLHPDAFVVTNFGLNHVGDYGNDPDALLGDKLSLDRYLPSDGVAFICYDDPKLREQQLTHRIISYAVSDAGADYHAKDVVEAEGRLEFLAVEKETGLETPVVVRAFGIHNVANALVAFAMGRWLQIPVEQILAGIYQYQGTGLRQNLTDLAGQKVLVDCYNASEVSAGSVAGALQTITPGPGGKRYLVFADIDDKLGDVTEEVHRRVGQNLATQSGIEKVFLFGEHAGWTAQEMAAAGANYFHTTSRAGLHRELQKTLTQQDVIAFKGGQQMALSFNIDDLYGSAFGVLDADVIRRRGTEFTAAGFSYTRMTEYGLVLQRVPRRLLQAELVIPGEVDGEPVRLISTGAGARRTMRSLVISPPIGTIAGRAFAGCRQLEKLTLPDSLRYVGQRAFARCTALTAVEIPAGVGTIDAEAFAGCENLESIIIPSSVSTIGEDAFTGCGNLTVHCEPGSYAQQYCDEIGIKVATA